MDCLGARTEAQHACGGLGGRAVIRRLLADRSVRGLELAFSGFNLAEYGVWVSVLVYAYGRGGTTVAAFVAVAQLLPAGLVAPVLAGIVDRRGAAATLRRGYWVQAGALAATSALLFAGASDLLVYAAAIVAACAVTVTRPAQAALVPELVSSSEQLTAINVLSGWVESVSVLAGPALAGALIMLDGPGAAVGCFAACVAGSALLIPRARAGRRAAAPHGADAAPGGGPISAIRNERGLAGLIALLGAEYFVIGALDVLVVVLAISVLGLGPSGPGYLDAAFGAGGVIGSIAAASLIRRRRLTAPMVAAATGWALLLALLSAWPTAVGAFLLLAAAGSARSLLDVCGRTILLRAAPPQLRGRVFGLLEGVAMFGLALGSMLVPLLVALGGVEVALIATGALLSAAALAAALQLHGVDELSSVRATILTRPERFSDGPLSAPELLRPTTTMAAR
jgi:MFS family permease